MEQLAAQGVIPRRAKGKFPLFAGVKAYVAWIKDEQRRASKTAADAGLKSARQREIELRIAEREHRLIDVEEHDAVLDEICGIYNSALVGLPARMTRDRELRARLETEIDAVRHQVADRCEQRARELRASGASGATGGDDD
ncbi:MAG: hypothetical protein J0H41_07045 [Rhizobiales bacterium]|nr:hypothetical protein [Hyphomicrobiales bacterium]